ncbi:RNA pseudouridylate synthase family protein (macronuclear) [Tetrahymena thermophila SB210]|uniref:RNA pseudouridylate synthase family protein n=1 Tax=Tetrahymena thermophila (strain SB210) TaxID=312017 RepID=I7M116_TETTS|nr:RNA pseudouridylate synthase family protein [Tetrahymena thermophila SB210]EAR93842.2 RNA pseudouridylate synthase family protein [Tetrahymena thermophila SB210]|eukprot:XP_001014087.2 RNA pseudouridylate synthase family protein [Tetrahymena thermophila SB210]
MFNQQNTIRPSLTLELLERPQDVQNIVTNEHYIQKPGMFEASDDESFFQNSLSILVNQFTFQMRWASHWAIIQLLKHSPALLNIYFIGHYQVDEDDLSPNFSPQIMISVAIGYMVFCILGQYPIQALANAFFELLCSKIHKQDQREIGRLLHIQLQLNTIFSILIMLFLYLFAPDIINFLLDHIEYKEEIVFRAHEYICYLFPSLFFSMVYENFQCLLSALDIRQTPLRIPLWSSLIHLSICLPFTIQGTFSIQIAGFAKGAADLTMAWMLYKYTFGLQDLNNRLVDFFFSTLDELVEMMLNTINLALFYYIETFNYDILTICLCILGIQTQQIQGHLIVTTLAFINFYVSQGISSSIYQGVKNYVEKGFVNKAINGAILGTVAALIISLLEIFLLLNIQVYVAKIFIQNDQKVLDYFIEYCNIYIYLLFVDNCLNSLLAILKSLQKHKLETVLHYVFFYAVGIPTSIFLANSLSDCVVGVWLGYLVANSMFVVFLIFYLSCGIVWDLEISQIQIKTNVEKATQV